MSKVKAANKVPDSPETITGRVIGRLDDIEAWFRDGFKTRQVLERLNAEGVMVQDSHLRRILRSFGKGERAVRRGVAGLKPNGPDTLPVSAVASAPKTEATNSPKTAGKKVTGPPLVQNEVARDLEQKLAARKKTYVERVRDEEDIV